MDNQFLRHLQSLTPEGKAAEKKLFIPADQFKAKEPEKIDMGDEVEVEELDEATRSKYLKAYAKHKVGTDTGKLELARMKRSAAMLRRGGADDETMRAGVADKGDMKTYNRVAMAKYRFANKAARSEEDGKKSPRNVKEEMELDEAILKGDSARRSILLRKNKEAKQQAAKFQDTVKWAGSPQTAALYTKPPEPSPTAKLRTRKTDKRGVEVGGKKDFSAAEKSAKAGQQNAEEIMDVLHRKPEGTKIKVFGKGPRGTDKTVHVHRKTELGKHKFYHSSSGKEVELVKGGVGLRVLDARTKRVILDRGNDAIWESTMNEAAPDVGQNLKGMPRKSARKLAYALKRGGDRSKEMARQTRKMGSNAKRWGKRLDTALSDFSKRTGIPLKEGSLGMKKGIRMSSAVRNKGHTDIGTRAQSAELRAISKINKAAGGTGRITTIPPKYKFTDAEYAAIQGMYKKGISGKIRQNAVRAARMRGRMGGSEMNEGNLKSSKFLDMMPSALRSAVKIHDKIKGTKKGMSVRNKPVVGPGNAARNYYRNLRSSVTEGMTPEDKKPHLKKGSSKLERPIQKKFASGKFSHQMSPAEYQRYFGRPKPMSEGTVGRAYKKGKKTAKRILRKLYKSLASPRDAADIMITGRNF